MTAEEILRTKKTYALVGASQDKDKYGYKYLRTLLDAGYTVYPINPRYDRIDGHKCYGSLADLPETPDVVILSLSPANTERMLDQIPAQYLRFVWMPPGSGSDGAVEKCRRLGVDSLNDVCPMATLAMMKTAQS